MLIKKIFFLFLCSTSIFPVYGMEHIQDIESKRSKPNTFKFPKKLTYEELCQIFHLHLPGTLNPREDKKIETAEGFLISHKASPVQQLKIQALLTIAKERTVVALGEPTGENSYTLGIKNPGDFADYALYIDGKLVKNSCFLASTSKPKTIQISQQMTSEVSNENLITLQEAPKRFPKKSSSSAELLPPGVEYEYDYLDCIVDLLVGNKIPDAFSPTSFEEAELLLSSYPVFTTGKNLSTTLNFLFKQFPEKKHLPTLMSCLNVLECARFPNRQKSLKEAQDEFDSQIKILSSEKLQKNSSELKDRTDFIKQIQELKSRILKGIIEVEKREKIITLLSSEDPMPIDGMTLNNFKFMNALLARDLALWPRNIGDLGNLKSENWKTFTFQANQTSDWVALQILSLPTKEARAVLYHKFCMQYRAFIDSGNFHGAAQITLGLTHPALSRLKIHEEAANEIEKNLIDIQNFITEGFGPYRVKENALKENSPYFPYGCVIGLELEQSKGNWELLQGDLKTQEDFDNRLFPVKIFSKILKKTWHLPVFPLELDDAYLKAVCSFKIHEDTPKVYSDLLDPNLSWRNLWSKLEPKNLEDWTPGYFAQKMREYECEHSIRVYFDNDVCEGTQLAKMEEKELIKWGGRHPMSREMIKFILSFPRKTQMETNHTASPRRKISDAIKPIRERPRNVEGALKQKKSTSRKGKEQNIQETVENKTSAKILMDENVNEVVTTTLHNKEIPILKVDNTGL